MMITFHPITKANLTGPATICAVLFLAFAHQNILSKPAQKMVAKQNVVSQAPLIIRVGAIYYDDSEVHYSAINGILSALEKQARNSPDEVTRSITFKLAVGTYDEVLNWYESDQIDLAIMNPGPLALLTDTYSHEELGSLFVGIRALVPPETSVASMGGLKPRAKYNSIMLLNRDAVSREFSSLGTKPTDSDLISLVVRKAKEKKAHFLFVHPLSTSGYIFPRKILKEAGVDLESADYDITYSHDVSTQRIKDSGYDNNDRLQVAFVSDETRYTLNDSKVLAIRGGLMSTKIAQDALLLTPDFVQRESAAIGSVKKLLQSSQNEQSFNLSTPPEWWKQYEEVKKWIDTFGGDQVLLSNELTIDQIITRINNYNRHHVTDPARVALVLSGGGAKCAYQLGAVEVIEDELAAAQKANPTQKLGIDLVVGTSGGAINALTIAAELTKNQNNRPNLISTWQSFGQSEILKPSDFVRRLLGVALGLIFSLCVLCILYVVRLVKLTRGFGVYEGEPRQTNRLGPRLGLWGKVWDPINNLTLTERAATILLVLALVLYLVGLKQITLTRQLSAETLLRHHVLIHVAEYGRQTLRWAALALLICGILLLLDSLLSARKTRYADSSRKWRPVFVMTVVLLSLILPVITLYRMVISEKTLFVSDGIVKKMGQEMPKLLGLSVSSESLPEISKEIIDKGLIKRDLVITGSMLQTPGVAPTQNDYARKLTNDDTDLYFVYKAGANVELPQKLRKDNRFVSLRDPDNASILLDAVIGSGAIFPAFEPRKLSGLKRIMDRTVTKEVFIIDGGFVHNSPIEAAIKLDATHIIVIEASPQNRPKEEVNLLHNSIVAFNHLFTQAQLLDARSRRQAEIFTLQPTSSTSQKTPFLCTLDFGPNFISRAIEWGTEDACDTKKPHFVRQPRPSGL